MKRKLIFVAKNIEEIVAGICLTIMVAVTFCDAIGRYFFHSPLVWGSELSMFLAGWATFLGMSAAYKRNQHLGMEFFINKLPLKHRLRIQRLLTAIMAALCSALTAVSWQFVLHTTKRTAIVRLSYRYIYAAAAVGFTFMTIYSAIYLYQSFFRKNAFREHFYPFEIQENDAGSDRHDG